MEWTDVCISCGRDLASWEKNRAECLDCRDVACETYSDDSSDTMEDYAS